MGNISLTNTNITVVAVPENNTLTIVDLSNSGGVTVVESSFSAIEVGIPGPRGMQGPSGSDATAGGLNSQIQFNSASYFSASSDFIFDYNTSTVILTGSLDITGSLTVNTINVGQNTLNFIDENRNIVNSLTVSGSNIIIGTGSIEALSGSFFSGSFTGSLLGTSSLATTSSYALSASYLIGGVDFSTLVNTSSFNAFTASYNTGSFTGSFIGDFQGTASYALNIPSIDFSGYVSYSIFNDYTSSIITTSSFNNFTSSINSFTQSILDWTGSVVTNAVFNSFTQSYNTGSFSGSLKGTADTASYYNETDPIYNAEKGRYLTTGSTGQNQTIVSSLTINQNLTVLGSQSVQYVTSSQLDISTNIITVNVANPAVRFGGIAVIDSGSSPQGSGSFLYDSVQDEFIFVHKGNGTNVTSSHFLVGPETYDSLGNEIYIPANTILKAVGNEHVTGSNITDTGTLVSINSETQVTGSLIVSNGISSSFSGSGANLHNIPASAIVGLNLSQIASGSYSASIANNQLLVNTGVSASSFTGSLLGTAATASYVSGSVFGSNNLALSASHALTASFALNGGGSPFYYQSSAPPTGSEPITGSMWVSSNTGVEYNLIYDGNSYQWVQQTLPVGPQGPQGVSGTNNIDTLTTTTLVGLLSGDGLTVSATTVSQSLGYVPEDVANKSIDSTFASNSDTLYPSQKAVKTALDNFADDVDYAIMINQKILFNL